MKKQKKDINVYKTFALISQLGFLMICFVLIGVTAGFYLGRTFGNKELFIVIGMIMGVLSGFYTSYKSIMKTIK